MFFTPLVGYLLAASFNSVLHRRFGQRGIALTCSSLRLVAYIIIAVHPPFPVIVCVYVLIGFGHGLANAAWNAWIGAFANANEVLGVLHGFYGLGATVSPVIASSILVRARLPWYVFYYVLVSRVYETYVILYSLVYLILFPAIHQAGAATIELISATVAFWKATGEAFVQSHPSSPNRRGNGLREALTKAPASRVTWLCMCLLFLYVGVEVALGGWLVTFMINIRKSSAFASSMTATGFWMGLTLGRVILGFVTPRIGAKYAVPVITNFFLTIKNIIILIINFTKYFTTGIPRDYSGFGAPVLACSAVLCFCSFC